MSDHLLVEHPDTYLPERKYILDILFEDFLGINYQSRLINDPIVRISRSGAEDKKQLLLPDILFQTPPGQWLSAYSLPEQPLPKWDIADYLSSARLLSSELPVVYGSQPYFSQSENELQIGIDIFGSNFFMLSRYEELVKPERDSYNRFPASASLAYQENLFRTSAGQ